MSIRRLNNLLNPVFRAISPAVYEWPCRQETRRVNWFLFSGNCCFRLLLNVINISVTRVLLV